MRAIISRNLYFFKLIFHCGSYFKAAYILFYLLIDLQRPISLDAEEQVVIKKEKTPFFKLFVFHNQKDLNEIQTT